MLWYGDHRGESEGIDNGKVDTISSTLSSTTRTPGQKATPGVHCRFPLCFEDVTQAIVMSSERENVTRPSYLTYLGLGRMLSHVIKTNRL